LVTETLLFLTLKAHVTNGLSYSIGNRTMVLGFFSLLLGFPNSRFNYLLTYLLTYFNY